MEEFFHSLSRGSKFSKKFQKDIDYFEKGKNSEVSNLLSSSNSQLTNLIPLKNIDFFKVEPIEKVEEVKPEEIVQEEIQEEDDENEYVETGEIHKKNANKIRFDNKILVLGTDCPHPVENFEELKQISFRSYLIKNVEKSGYKKPTPVQMQAIPAIMKKRECLVSAPTGSGKTAAYVLPILASLNKPSKEGIRALIIAPTAVLVRQITREFEKFGAGKDWRIMNLDKSLKYTKQKIKSKRNDILIATPKKLVGLIAEKDVDLSNVEFLILDEADQLLGDKFDQQLDEIITACGNSQITRGLYSATLPIEVEHLAKTFLRNPITIVIGERNTSAETITQSLEFVGSEAGKLFALRRLLRKGIQPPILIFVQSIEKAQDLYKELQFDDLNIDYIHGARSHGQTKEVVNNFRLGKLFVLICTDVMARGIDFKGVSCVINYDFPQSIYQYIHRIGRCGRAGAKGTAITYFTVEEIDLLKQLGKDMMKSKCPIPEWMDEIKKLEEEEKEEMNTTEKKGIKENKVKKNREILNDKGKQFKKRKHEEGSLPRKKNKYL